MQLIKFQRLCYECLQFTRLGLELGFQRARGVSIPALRYTEKIALRWCTGGFRGTLNWAPMMPKDASLSDNYAFDRCYFSSVAYIVDGVSFIYCIL